MTGYGDKLRYLREAAGLTLRELGSKLRVSYSVLSQYETERRRPSDRVKHKLAQFYGKPVQELFFS